MSADINTAVREAHIQDLLQHLNRAKNEGPEEGHITMDRLLLDFINDDRVTEAFDSLRKWYA